MGYKDTDRVSAASAERSGWRDERVKDCDESLSKVRPGHGRCARRMTVGRETTPVLSLYIPSLPDRYPSRPIMSSLKESHPLIIPARPPSSYSSIQSPIPDDPPPLNDVSRVDFFWIVSGLWSAVFLGALDGTFPLHLQSSNPNLVPTGTVVATLVSPIGSYFNKSEQSSYLGTSYLLSVCCFTPLYGEHLRSPSPPSL